MLRPADGSVKRDAPRRNDDLVVVALGSNVGDRRSHLRFAREELARSGFRWTRLSPVIETAPVGGPPGQGAYLNQVLAAPTSSVRPGPGELLRVAHEIEARRGRVRGGERGAPRTLDVDIIFYGALVTHGDPPVLPHPRAAGRLFVLEPLAAIAPGLVHPALGETVSVLLDRLRRAEGSRRARPVRPHTD